MALYWTVQPSCCHSYVDDNLFSKLVQVAPGKGSHLTQVTWQYEENSCREVGAARCIKLQCWQGRPRGEDRPLPTQPRVSSRKGGKEVPSTAEGRRKDFMQLPRIGTSYQDVSRILRSTRKPEDTFDYKKCQEAKRNQ